MVSVEVNTESSMNKLNKRGPAMETWGTPACYYLFVLIVFGF